MAVSEEDMIDPLIPVAVAAEASDSRVEATKDFVVHVLNEDRLEAKEKVDVRFFEPDIGRLSIGNREEAGIVWVVESFLKGSDCIRIVEGWFVEVHCFAIAWEDVDD